MKICLLAIGATQKKWVQEGEKEYVSRIGHYVSFERLYLNDLRNTKSLSHEQQKALEGEMLLSKIDPSDCVVLLDEKGKELDSVSFASDIQKYMNSGVKRLVFIIGGPYGFSSKVYERAQGRLLSLSRLTFPHDLIRVVFLEQLYRAYTILGNEPYHHV